MAKERIYVKGHTGILSVKDATTYKPLVCITSTSVDRKCNTSEMVNYCTEGDYNSNWQYFTFS